jgi:hypothetical protein
MNNAFDVSSTACLFKAGEGSMVIDCSGGSVTNTGDGIIGVAGNKCTIIKNCSISDCKTDGEFDGVSVTNGCIITGCRIIGNSGDSVIRGIRAGNGNSITENRIVQNGSSFTTDEYGIRVQSGNAMSHNSISGSDYGIKGDDANLVTASDLNTPNRTIDLSQGCLARNNSIFNGDIYLGNGGLIAGCNLLNATISGGYDIFITENHVVNSGTGIKIVNGYCRVDGNFINADPDVDAGGSHNLIVRNYAQSFSTTNAADDHVSEQLTGSSSFSTSQPWANLSQ